MMEKDKLRKADIFSGSLIFILGLWIMSQALKMPMKDSWGGVQNVWFVSPAIFPLFVGSVISLLGGLLIRTAMKEVGVEALKNVLRWLMGPECIRFLKTASSMRFYAMLILFFSFVYLNIPRIDFFLCSILFLIVFISMFYFEDDTLLKKLLKFYLFGILIWMVLLFSGVSTALSQRFLYTNDLFAVVFIIAYCIYTWKLIRNDPGLRKKYKLSLLLALAAPFLICSIFKYLLLVPMPHEGVVVLLMDALWYGGF